MPTDIDPFAGRLQPPAVTTGGASAGVKGVPPIPMGRAVQDKAKRVALTDVERTSLEAIGWDDSVEIPKNMAELFYQATEELKNSPILLPVDPRKKPIKVNTVDLNTLPEPEKKKILAAMAQAVADQKAADEAIAAEAHREELAMRTPGMSEAMLAVDAATIVADAKTVDAVKAPAPEPAISTTETGAAPLMTHCPHCAGDLSQPGLPEPDYADKMSFMACILGGIVYSKTYTLMGGNVCLAFRTLTVPEIDVVFRQAHLDRVAGKFSEDLDFYEAANRYRMYLQLSAYHTGIGANNTALDLPDGYSKALNPAATGVWVQPEQEAALGLNQTGLPDIEKTLLAKVFRAESLFRIAHTACKQFNRLVAKMDAQADNSDFWKPTAGLSS